MNKYYFTLSLPIFITISFSNNFHYNPFRAIKQQKYCNLKCRKFYYDEQENQSCRLERFTKNINIHFLCVLFIQLLICLITSKYHITLFLNFLVGKRNLPIYFLLFKFFFDFEIIFFFSIFLFFSYRCPQTFLCFFSFFSFLLDDFFISLFDHWTSFFLFFSSILIFFFSLHHNLFLTFFFPFLI